MSIHVLLVPEHETHREPYGARWCFHCRARLHHDKVVLVPDDPMSYYGPRVRLECERCKGDFVVFPGEPSRWEEVV